MQTSYTESKIPVVAKIVLAIFYGWLVERGDYETYEPSEAEKLCEVC